MLILSFFFNPLCKRYQPRHPSVEFSWRLDMPLHSQQPFNQSVHSVVVPCGSTLSMHRTVRTLPELSLMSFSLSWHQLKGNETKVLGLCLIESEGWEFIRQSRVVKLLRAGSVRLHLDIKLSGYASHCWSHYDFHGSGIVLCDKTWWIHTPGNTAYLFLWVSVASPIYSKPLSRMPFLIVQLHKQFVCDCLCVGCWSLCESACVSVCLLGVCEGPGKRPSGHFKACVRVKPITQLSEKTNKKTYW